MFTQRSLGSSNAEPTYYYTNACNSDEVWGVYYKLYVSCGSTNHPNSACIIAVYAHFRSSEVGGLGRKES